MPVIVTGAFLLITLFVGTSGAAFAASAAGTPAAGLAGFLVLYDAVQSQGRYQGHCRCCNYRCHAATFSSEGFLKRAQINPQIKAIAIITPTMFA